MSSTREQPRPVRKRSRVLLKLAITSLLVVSPGGRAQPQPDALARERPFLDENEAAMRRMMSAMTLAPTGDVDHDFAAMMIAHHQGAIDMAVAELRHGRNEQLRRIAQEIVITQTDEIRAMRSAIGADLPVSAAIMSGHQTSRHLGPRTQ